MTDTYQVWATRKDNSTICLAAKLSSFDAMMSLLEHVWSLTGDAGPYRNAFMRTMEAK
jgi:hypothetical protein